MARPIVMPSFGMYTAEGTLEQWLKPSGVRVELGEPVAEIETDKAIAEVTAPETGILHHVAQPGALLEVESLLGYVLAPGEVPPTPEAAPRSLAPASSPPRAPASPTHSAAEMPVATPNARRLARELGVELAGLRGTGPGGRITEVDVRAALEDRAG